MTDLNQLRPYQQQFVLRFYGSCGHTTDEPITAEKFAEWSAPRVVHHPVYSPAEHQNEVTQEGDAQIVHVYPFRWCCCEPCMLGELES